MVTDGSVPAERTFLAGSVPEAVGDVSDGLPEGLRTEIEFTTSAPARKDRSFNTDRVGGKTWEPFAEDADGWLLLRRMGVDVAPSTARAPSTAISFMLNMILTHPGCLTAFWRHLDADQASLPVGNAPSRIGRTGYYPRHSSTKNPSGRVKQSGCENSLHIPAQGQAFQ